MWNLLATLRFFFALVVAATHLRWFVGEGDPVAGALIPFSAFVAVLAFLVVSGFSIGASIEKRPEAFYARRINRIVPLYVFAILFSSLLPIAFGGEIRGPQKSIQTPGLWEFFGNLLLLQNFALDQLNSNPVVWTLSLEVFFYLLTPLLVKTPSRVLVLACAASLLAYASTRYLDLPHFSRLLYGANVLFMGWAWCGGFLLWRHRSSRFWRVCLFGAGGAALFFTIRLKFPLWWLAWGALFAVVEWGQNTRLGKTPAAVCRVLGDASYPLYLFHFPVFFLVFALGWPASPFVYLGAAIVASIAVDRLYDVPVRAALRRLVSRRRGRTAT